MDSPPHPVKIQILGRQIVIKSRADMTYIQEVAKYVDYKMREASELSAGAPLADLAILVCLNITDELFRERKDKERLLSLIEDRSKDLADSLNEQLE